MLRASAAVLLASPLLLSAPAARAQTALAAQAARTAGMPAAAAGISAVPASLAYGITMFTPAPVSALPALSAALPTLRPAPRIAPALPMRVLPVVSPRLAPRRGLPLLARIRNIIRPKGARRITPQALDRLFTGAIRPETEYGPPASGGIRLMPGRWLPENRARLKRVIREYGRGGPKWDPERPPVAALDWDNTMIRHDIGEALLYYAVSEMRFKFELGDRFWETIHEELGRDAIRQAYEAIAHLPLSEAKRTPEYRRYRKLFLRAYELSQTHEDLGIDYGWLVQLMIGYTPKELERLADEVIDFETGRPLGEELIKESDDDPDPIVIDTGIRLYAEMVDLVARLQAAGWDVRVVSASNEWTVARFAARAGIPRENVHGVLAKVRRGRITTEVTQKTWDKGKADVILKKTGRRPKLAAGDNPIDIHLLRSSEGEQLVIDLGREPLRSIALREGWMLQHPFLRRP